MRKFREFISEEILPFAQTEKGFVGIDNGPVRDNINLLLANVTTMPYSTPYHALEAVRKTLISFHIALPATQFLDGDEGVEVFPINQFGKKMGVLPTGEVVTQMPSAYYVYFEYAMNEKGSFDIFSEIVDDEELQDLMSDIEDEEEDIETDASDTQDVYKMANASLSEQIVYRGDDKESAQRRKIMLAYHSKKTKKTLPSMQKEETLNELSKGTLGSYIKKASHDVATKSAAVGRYADRANKARDKMKKGDYSDWQQGKKDDEFADKMFKKSWKRREGIAKATDKLTKEEAINEISKQLAIKASEKAYEKGSDYYDSTAKLRGKAIKSKDKGDMDAANAEQGKMSKKWKQSMKFKAYADKK